MDTRETYTKVVMMLVVQVFELVSLEEFSEEENVMSSYSRMETSSRLRKALGIEHPGTVCSAQ